MWDVSHKDRERLTLFIKRIRREVNVILAGILSDCEVTEFEDNIYFYLDDEFALDKCRQWSGAIQDIFSQQFGSTRELIFTKLNEKNHVRNRLQKAHVKR